MQQPKPVAPLSSITTTWKPYGSLPKLFLKLPPLCFQPKRAGSPKLFGQTVGASIASADSPRRSNASVRCPENAPGETWGRFSCAMASPKGATRAAATRGDNVNRSDRSGPQDLEPIQPQDLGTIGRNRKRNPPYTISPQRVVAEYSRKIIPCRCSPRADKQPLPDNASSLPPARAAQTLSGSEAQRLARGGDLHPLPLRPDSSRSPGIGSPSRSWNRSPVQDLRTVQGLASNRGRPDRLRDNVVPSFVGLADPPAGRPGVDPRNARPRDARRDNVIDRRRRATARMCEPGTRMATPRNSRDLRAR